MLVLVLRWSNGVPSIKWRFVHSGSKGVTRSDFRLVKVIDSVVWEWFWESDSSCFVDFCGGGETVSGNQKVEESSEIIVYVEGGRGGGCGDCGYVEFEMQGID